MITPTDLAALARDASAIPQSNPTIPLVQRCNELAGGLTHDDYFAMLPHFGNNVMVLSVWLSGFTTAIAVLERDERLG